MRKAQGLAQLTWMLGAVCILTTNYTVLYAESGKTATHEAGGINEYGGDEKSPTEARVSVPEPVREALNDLKDEALQNFAAQIGNSVNLNPEVFDAIVDSLPKLSEDSVQDARLRAELKDALRKNASELGADPKANLKQVAQEILAERKKNAGEVASAEQGKEVVEGELAALQQKLKELSEKVDGAQKEKGDALASADELKKQLEEAVQKAGDAEEQLRDLADNKGEEIDPNALANQNAGQGAQDPGAGSADTGSGSGSGSGSGGGSSPSGSSPSERSKPEKPENRLSDLNRTLDAGSESKPETAKEESKPESSKPFRSAKSDTSSESSESGKSDSLDGALPGNSQPVIPEAPVSGPQKLGQLGKKSPLESVAASANASASSPANPSGAPSGPVSVVGASGAQAQQNESGFPYSSPPPATSGVAAGTKFEYTRANRYGESSGEFSTEAGVGEEFLPDLSPVLGSAGTPLVGRGTRTAARGIAAERPAFEQALSVTLGNLCARGSLQCDRAAQAKTR